MMNIWGIIGIGVITFYTLLAIWLVVKYNKRKNDPLVFDDDFY